VREMKKLLSFVLLLGLLSTCAHAITLEAGISKEAAAPKVSAPYTREAIPVDTVIWSTMEEYVPPSNPLIRDLPRSSFLDMPADHWAAGSVDNLVKMGITQGYPDGTFRGTNNLSRYEMATFLSKLAHKKTDNEAMNEKLLSELHSEIHKLRYMVDTYKKPKVNKPAEFSFLSRLMMGNIVSANSASTTVNAPIGPVFDYRLKASYKQDLNGPNYLKFGIDTMDSAQNKGRDFAREMLETEAYGEFSPGLGIRLTTGPGPVIHKEGPANIFPSEDNKVFLRPSNGIEMTYDIWSMSTSLGYKAITNNSMGTPSLNDIHAGIGYTAKATFLGDVTMNYGFSDLTSDLRARSATAEAMVHMYEIYAEPGSRLRYGLKIASVAGAGSNENLFVGFSFISRGFFRENSSFKLFANKIGNEFISYPVHPSLLGLNVFDKYYANGTYDVGFEITQYVSRTLTLRILSDIVTGPQGQYGKNHPSSNACFEFDMDFGIFDSAVMTVAYRTYQVPSAATNVTSDMLGLFFKYDY
jgi:hypothetical protein